MTPSTPATTAAGALATLREMLAANQHLLETIYRLNTHGSVREHDWEEGGVGNLIAKRISENRSALRNSAPQETRGDEPVADLGQLLADLDVTARNFPGGLGDRAAKAIRSLQQSPRLARAGTTQTIPNAEDIARTICLSYGRDPDEMTSIMEMCDAKNRPVPTWRVYEEQADAILALLSPPGPMVPWELDCQRRICAAPECECPAVSSTSQVWQPADTAPQDGSTIEVRFLTDNPRRVRWSQSDRGTYWHLADSNGPAIINFNPTEWRPVSSKNRGAV